MKDIRPGESNQWEKIPTSETLARASSAQIKADRITCILLDKSYDDDDDDSRAFHFCQTGGVEQVKRERGIPGRNFCFSSPSTHY
jgi:hypothetical protein